MKSKILHSDGLPGSLLPDDFLPGDFLPGDGDCGLLVGRVWLPARLTGSVAGPAPVLVRDDGVWDLTPLAPTVSQLVEALGDDPDVLRTTTLIRLARFETVLRNSLAWGAHSLDPTAAPPDAEEPRFLAPVDLQAIKACGVTFVRSLFERLIEERTQGDPSRAAEARRELEERVGSDLGRITPGSPQAAALKSMLVEAGQWSQYLEVGLGPDAEVFTKAQPLSAVGLGAAVGIHPDSLWNNPEPEVVLVVDSRGTPRGATLGNDVNLRDVEGRSALLLGKAKDNNASCAIGPFVRLFDDRFDLDSVRRAEVSLVIEGGNGFRLEERYLMAEIGRDLLDLVQQTVGPHHQYPDGLALFTGTLFAPTHDRDGVGEGFTHHRGDVVTIRSEPLGTLLNPVMPCDQAPPWSFGIAALIENLARRGVLEPRMLSEHSIP